MMMMMSYRSASNKEVDLNELMVNVNGEIRKNSDDKLRVKTLEESY